MATVKLDINRELSAVAFRKYDFYSSLTDQEKKDFSPFVLMRFTGNPTADEEVYEWFVERTNEMVNKDHWLLSSKHKELLWLLYAGTGVGIPCRFQYLAANKKTKINKLEKLISEQHPLMKTDDVVLLASLMTTEEINQLFEGLGFDLKQRKDYL